MPAYARPEQIGFRIPIVGRCVYVNVYAYACIGLSSVGPVHFEFLNTTQPIRMFRKPNVLREAQVKVRIRESKLYVFFLFLCV